MSTVYRNGSAASAQLLELIDYRAEGVHGVRERAGEKSYRVRVTLDLESLNRAAVAVERGDDALKLRSGDDDVVLGHGCSLSTLSYHASGVCAEPADPISYRRSERVA